MNRKLPADCFGIYLAMGTERSYSKLAKQLGVNKRTITARATAEKWQERLAEIERKARERVDQKAVESIEQMNTRHLKTLNAVLARGLEALRTKPLETGMDAVRTIAIALKEERLLRTADGFDRTESALQEAARTEIEKLLVVEEDGKGARD